MRPALALAALLALAAPAQAQETLLRLSESAERTVRADELHATLRATASGNSAAAVQQEVNRKMAAALSAPVPSPA